MTNTLKNSQLVSFESDFKKYLQMANTLQNSQFSLNPTK